MLASQRVSIELYVMVDECGDYVVSTDPDILHEKWQEEINDDLPTVSRVVTLKLDVELPRMCELAAVVDAAALEAAMIVSQEQPRLRAFPDLLAALEQIVADWKSVDPINVNSLFAARAAIAKAKGEQP